MTAANRILRSYGESITEGDSVTAAGRRYVVLRVEPVRIFGAFSHNECILKLKGGAADA